MAGAQLLSGQRVRLIPVLDIVGGQVVRAVGGRRELYAPVRSKLTDSTDPKTVAEVLLAAAGVNELFVADVDAIQGHRPRIGWVKELTARGVKMLIDAGLRTAADAKPVADVGATVVAATETLRTTDELMALVGSYGPDGVVLSIDLRNGRLLGTDSGFGSWDDPLAAVEAATVLGVRRVIALELARVGTGVGPGTVALCERIRGRFPAVELISGGGVRNQDDVNRLAAVGVNGVLVASALHDGAIGSPPRA
jgi:phosphoribosylformimino-5-aminoimidazole carboxamide ribotide isomerase